MNNLRMVRAALESCYLEATDKGKPLLEIFTVRSGKSWDSSSSFVSSHTSGGRTTQFAAGTGSSGLSQSDAANINVYLIELHERALAALGIVPPDQADISKNLDVKNLIASYLRPVTQAVNDWRFFQK